MTKYDVDLQVGVSGYAYVTITVEAESEAKAKELAQEESFLVSELEDMQIEDVHRPWYVESIQASDAA